MRASPSSRSACSAHCSTSSPTDKANRGDRCADRQSSRTQPRGRVAADPAGGRRCALDGLHTSTGHRAARARPRRPASTSRCSCATPRSSAACASTRRIRTASRARSATPCACTRAAGPSGRAGSARSRPRSPNTALRVSSSTHRLDALAGVDREPRGQRRGPRQIAERVLDQPVLERVEADDRAAPAHRSRSGNAARKRRELVELGVDRDAQRLERARRRVDLRLALLHHRDRPGRRPPRAAVVVSIRSSWTASLIRRAIRLRVALFAELADQLAEVVGVDRSQQLERGLAPRRIHPHVERALFAEREPALGVIELRRRHPEVEPGTRRPCRSRGRREFCEYRRARRGRASRGRRTVSSRGGEGGWVAIDANHAAAGWRSNGLPPPTVQST